MKCRQFVCRCEICLLNRRIRRDVTGGSKQRLRILVEELNEKYQNTDMDLNYLQAIMDGSWPSAVEQLQRALDNAIAKQGARSAR